MSLDTPTGQPMAGPRGIELVAVPGPRPLTTVSGWRGPPISDRQRISLYSFDEWEAFILEWIDELRPQYMRIFRPAGSGDGGLDVVGLRTEQGLEGDWDNFQCKHYGTALTPSDAVSEIIKIINTVAHSGYKFPSRYEFVAPKGAGTTLARLINSPTNLKQHFLNKYSEVARMKFGLDPQRISEIGDAARALDFKVFGVSDLSAIIAVHKNSPYHNIRFGKPLPEREVPPQPPAEVEQHEATYIQELMDVYSESLGLPGLTTEGLNLHRRWREHYSRQREAFYSAEALRLFARDCVPPGTYESLQQEFYDGIVDTHDSNHPTRLQRLTRVLEVAKHLQVTSNDLIHRCFVRDRGGICHQLANEGRLSWRGVEQS